MGQEVGGKRKREGPHTYLWLIHIDMLHKPVQHCKAIILQLKINKLKKKDYSSSSAQGGSIGAKIGGREEISPRVR